MHTGAAGPMSVPMVITIEREGTTPLVLRFKAKERQEAMNHWDKAVENALPGQRVRLINENNNRIVSEYTNNRQS